MVKYFRIINIVLIFLFSTFFLSITAIADNIIVNFDGTGDYTSIQDAINDANNGDVITVMTGTYFENINMNGKAVTLQSSDPENPSVVSATIIDGCAAGSVIRCVKNETSSTVINGFVLTNGRGTDIDGLETYTGGGIYNKNSSVMITNCIFTGNTALYGGGFASRDGSPKILKCRFYNNHATEYGGAIYNWDNLTVNNCTFIKNTADDCGGAVYNRYVFTTPTISNSTFKFNSATNYGGAVYNMTAIIKLQNCDFSYNTAANGAGVANYLPSGDSSYSKMYLYDSTVSYNSATNSGGAMYNSSTCPLILKNTISCSNTPNDLQGYYVNSGGNNFMTYCPPPVPLPVDGDFDGDFDVDFKDFAIFADNWLNSVE